MLIDFHIHARQSSFHLIDANRIERVLSTAINAGMEAIVIVDHNSLKASFLAKQIQREKKLPILIIPGVEITTIWGMKLHHLIALNIKQDILPFMGIKRVIRNIREQGGIVILPHPSIEMLNDIYEYIDGFEIFNGRHNDNKIMDLTKNSRFERLIKTWGSDAHTLEEIGKVAIDIDENYLREMKIIR